MFLGRNKVIFGTTWRWINYVIFGCAIPLRFLWFFRGVVRWSDCTGWRLWRSDVSHVLVQFFLGSGHLNHLNRRAHEAAPAWSHHCNPVGRKNKAAIKIHLYQGKGVVCASHLTCFSSTTAKRNDPVGCTSCRHQQPSFKCIARQPEHWQGMLNILPESFADFKQKIRIKNETCFSLFFRCGTFCIHTDKTTPCAPTHTENMV